MELAEKLALLVQYFHRRSLDIPEGLISRHCVFKANGQSYEDTLGTPIADPLTRLLGQGPAAYRFLAQGLHYAMPDGTIQLEGLQGNGHGGLVTGLATLRGTPRGASEPLSAGIDVALVTDGKGSLLEVGVQVAERILTALDLARRS